MDLLSRCLAGESGAWDLWVAEAAPVISVPRSVCLRIIDVRR
jgi:hypothetical protein